MQKVKSNKNWGKKSKKFKKKCKKWAKILEEKEIAKIGANIFQKEVFKLKNLIFKAEIGAKMTKKYAKS